MSPDDIARKAQSSTESSIRNLGDRIAETSENMWYTAYTQTRQDILAAARHSLGDPQTNPTLMSHPSLSVTVACERAFKETKT
jgi:hypothetical protein